MNLTLKRWRYWHLDGYQIRSKGGHRTYGIVVRPPVGPGDVTRGWLVHVPSFPPGDAELVQRMWHRVRDGRGLNANEAYVGTLSEAKAFAYEWATRNG